MLFGIAGSVLIGIGALNLIADPFRVFGTPRRKGINDQVPNTSGFDRVAKPYEVLRVMPRTVVVGSSTAHSGFVGIDGWRVTLPRPIYNYALLGASAHEVRLSLEQALRECSIEVAVMVADFFAFNVHYRDNERFDPTRLTAATRRRWPGFLASDFFAFSLGSDALALSCTTVHSSWSQDGRSTVAPNYSCLTHFRNCERSYVDKWFPPPARKYEFSSPQEGWNRLTDLDLVLRVCADHGIRLIIICPPIHARFQEAVAAVGAWPLYEEWKREVAMRTRLKQRQMSGSGTVELWDFSLFNEMTCEAIPTDGTQPMRYFFDSAHFTPHFGQVVLDEILKRSPHFGVRLDQAEIELHLAELRGDLQRFRIANPGVVADVRAALGIANGNVSPLDVSAMGY